MHDARAHRPRRPRDRSGADGGRVPGGPASHSPNDVVVGPDGAVWFTDPTYGHLQGFRPEPAVRDAVNRFDPGPGRLSVVADTLDKSNGLAFSPDGSAPYLAAGGVGGVPGYRGSELSRRWLARRVRHAPCEPDPNVASRR